MFSSLISVSVFEARKKPFSHNEHTIARTMTQQQRLKRKPKINFHAVQFMTNRSRMLWSHLKTSQCRNYNRQQVDDSTNQPTLLTMKPTEKILFLNKEKGLFYCTLIRPLTNWSGGAYVSSSSLPLFPQIGPRLETRKKGEKEALSVFQELARKMDD